MNDTIRVTIHHDHDAQEPTCRPTYACWWAESDDLPGWTGAADDLAELLRFLGEVIEFHRNDMAATP